MAGLLGVLLAYPTVVFTGFLGLVLLYWLFVILGALDIDLFHADAEGLEGAAKGAFEGAAKGVFEGAGKAGLEALDGALDGGADAALEGVDGAVDGAAEGVEGAEGAKGGVEAAGLLHALNLRRAPITVTFSLIIFFSWVMSYFAVTYLGPIATTVLPSWLFNTLVMIGVFFLSLPLTSLATKPMEHVFQTKSGKSRIEFIGSECRIKTGRVDDDFGQAEVEDGGAGLLIQVRNESGKLKRGDRALIIDFDREHEVYIVEEYDAMLKERGVRE